MNPGGVVLILSGIWVLAQILGGQAIQRLDLVPDVTK